MLTILKCRIVFFPGQGFKDIIRWPRPGYPVKKLQQKWAVEYGMPSTHAMVGVSIPFSVLLYTMDRYQYPVHWGVVIAVSWCTLICVSRVYLGMHSVLVRCYFWSFNYLAKTVNNICYSFYAAGRSNDDKQSATLDISYLFNI